MTTPRRDTRQAASAAVADPWRPGVAPGDDLGPAVRRVALASCDGEDWRARGACVNADPEIFFPLPRSSGRAQLAAARALCAACEVRDPCLAFALRTRQDHGIWGGTTEEERLTRRRASRRRLPHASR
jgi:WhiB family redox-sensing transcriptional regulator